MHTSACWTDGLLCMDDIGSDKSAIYQNVMMYSYRDLRDMYGQYLFRRFITCRILS